MDKYKLSKNKSIEFINDNLLGTNQLSTALIEQVNFDKGEFYSFLPKKVVKDNIEKFRLGGIAVGVKGYVKEKVLKKLYDNRNLIAVFDSAISLYSEEKEDAFFNEFGKNFNEEIYYLISSNQVTEKNIDECFFRSNAIWHSLCVLYKEATELSQVQLSKQYFEELCKQISCIIIGAYDGEGYIFWEPED